MCSINAESLGPATPPGFTFDYIDISSVSRGQISWHDVRRLKFKDAPSRARRRLRLGDVLLCTVRPALQAHAHITADNAIPRVGSTGFAALRPHDPRDSSYLFHQLFSDDLGSQLRAMETGSNYPAVNERDIARLRLFAPDVDQRARIAAVLDAVDSTIENTATVIAKLKLARMGLLHDLLTRGLDHNGDLRDPVVHPEQFKDSPLGIIPTSWDYGTIANFCDLRNELRLPISQTARDKMQGRFPYYGPTGVLDSINEFRVEGQFALIGEDGDHFLKYETDPMTLLVEGRFNVNNHAHILAGRGDCSTHWIYLYFCHRNLRRFLLHQGGGRLKLNKGSLLSIPMAVPKPDEQHRIRIGLESVDGRIATEISHFEKIEHMKTGLMADLLTGRVPVPPRIEMGGA